MSAQFAPQPCHSRPLPSSGYFTMSESLNDLVARFSGVDRLRCLLHHSFVLVPDPSPARVLAITATVAISSAVTRLVADVGGDRDRDGWLAACQALFDDLLVDPCRPAIRLLILAVFAFQQDFQRAAAWRLA